MPNIAAALSPLVLLAIAAATLPSLLAYNVSPSPTFLNQALALALWGSFLALGGAARPATRSWPLLAALLLVGAGAAGSWLAGGLPATLALSAIGLLLATVALVAGGAGGPGVFAASAQSGPDEPAQPTAFVAFCWAWLAAGLLNVAIALLQVFAPELADGQWIAASGMPGRAIGNLRQPNHLSSLLLWGCIAVVALVQMRRLAWRWGAAAGAALVFAVVLTASRTGLVSVVLLAVWGALDRRLHRSVRGLLLAAPLLYALAWFGMAQWASLSDHAFGGTQRLAESDISSSRFGIWANTLALIRAQPWLGTGFGEFNFAWTLTPFPGRPTAFFDHTHNLPLQLAVELGLPLAALVMGLLLWAMWRGLQRAWSTEDDAGSARRCAMLMVVMIGLHSLLEYPLWYAYFLLPTAWAWGFALADDAAPAAAATPPAPPGRRAMPWPAWAGLALVAGAGFAVLDYTRVVAIFEARPGDAPLAQRIADGRRSMLFGHHADYAAVTSGAAGPVSARDFDRATHYLLDTRLMMAWAETLHQQGHTEAAKHVAARLREFRKADAAEFFAPCAAAAVPAGASAALPFPCQADSQVLPWRALLRLQP